MLNVLIEWFIELVTNKVFLSAGLAWLIAQLIKIIIDLKKYKRFSMSWIFESGGFPSSHTSTTVALTTALFMQTGISNVSILSLMLTLIVIQDAYKLRYQVGKHAKILNKLKNAGLDEKIGHTHSEIIGGAILGLIIAILLHLFL